MWSGIWHKFAHCSWIAGRRTCSCRGDGCAKGSRQKVAQRGSSGAISEELCREGCHVWRHLHSRAAQRRPSSPDSCMTRACSCGRPGL